MKIKKKTNFLLVPIIAGLALGFIILFEQSEAKVSVPDNDDGILKAVIIDQLHEGIPNKYFQKIANESLTGAGYEVELFTTKDITVDFYKQLPSKDYDYIVIRSHGLAGRTPEDSPKLYTNEVYTTDKFVSEQLFGIIDGAYLNPRTAIRAIVDVTDLEENGQVVFSMRNSSQANNWGARVTTDQYFVIGAKTIKELMVGQFPGSTIILAGCDTMTNTLLADAFLEKGASEIVGWEGSVYAYENDRALIEILRQTLDDKIELSEVVESLGKDSIYRLDNSTTLHYYSDKPDEET